MNRFLQRVALRNYKSIASCDVELPALCFLVGPNGAGKSNFLDALRLVSDALYTSLDIALRDRGGVEAVCRRSPDSQGIFHIRLDFELPSGQTGHYAFSVGAQNIGGLEVLGEECSILPAPSSPPTARSHYRLARGKVLSSSIPVPPAAKSDRLYLVNASGLEEFRPLYDSLSRMGFYNLSPDAIRHFPASPTGIVLSHDGSNLASVLANLAAKAPETRAQVEELLSEVVPQIASVTTQRMHVGDVLEFRQGAGGASGRWAFAAADMSDGTLRALGVLVALFQSASMPENPTPLVGIEEPENALHPGAVGVLRDALRAASTRTQVLVTTHSPDLLDDKDVEAGSLLAVTNTDGVTTIAPVDEASRSAIEDRLYTAGELLRANQLSPDPVQVCRQECSQTDLFEKRPQ